MKHVFWDRPRQELGALFGGHSEHQQLHGRVLGLLGVSTLLGSGATVAVHLWDTHGLADGPLSDAAVWTVSQMVAAGSSVAVASSWARVLEVLLQIYSVTVIAALAGSFAAFFLENGRRRAAEAAGSAVADDPVG